LILERLSLLPRHLIGPASGASGLDGLRKIPDLVGDLLDCVLHLRLILLPRHVLQQLLDVLKNLDVLRIRH
jgi:hypothetical protein